MNEEAETTTERSLPGEDIPGTDDMTAKELGSMAACEMIVATAPALAARTMFRHQRDCGGQLRRLHDENAQLRAELESYRCANRRESAADRASDAY